MLKRQLRQDFLEKRRFLSAEQRLILTAKISTQFMELIGAETQVVHVFLPMEHKHELNTWSIIRSLWDRQYDVVVPVMDFENNILLTRRLLPTSTFINNKWGVPEPEGGEVINSEEIDVVVAPLLAFDLSGYRIGYGKGYYDRFLHSFKKLPTIIGLSFFPPVPKIVDVAPHDIKMHFCITPEQIFRF